MTDPHPATLSLSALQIAWLAELGIEKPWLPAQAALPAQHAGEVVRKSPSQPRPAKQAPAVVAAKPVVQKIVQTTATSEHVADLADLAALSAAVHACTACGLCSARQQAIMGEGVAQPAIMVVGEAPGEQDDRQGQAFVGRPGVLLDNMLAAIQSGRGHDAYVTTIIKCRPTGNRNPRPEEVAACQPYLMREIALQQPFTILALGRFAAQALLGSEEPLQALRERTHSIQVGGRLIPLVVSYNPSYLLSHPNEKAAAWKDLQRLKALCRVPLGQSGQAS
jgi:uracil-DNA glycosylase family 4